MIFKPHFFDIPNFMRTFSILIALGLTTCAAPAASILIRDTLSVADAANYHYSVGATYVPLRDSSGVQLPLGSDFRIGFFLNYSESLNASLGTASYGSLFEPANPNRFIQIGTGGTTAGDLVDPANYEVRTVGAAARAITTISNITYAAGVANAVVNNALTRGTKIFLIATNGQDFSVAPSEWGIFSGTEWVVPAIGDADLTAAFKEVDTPGEVFRGSLGSLRTAAVPEPSISFLALGAMIWIKRRRR
jgi:hypothetical protein